MSFPFHLALIFGASGMGKTTFIGSLAEEKETLPALCIDAESGLLPIEDKINRIQMNELLKPAFVPHDTKIDAIRVNNYEEYITVVRHIVRKKIYKACAIDSMTEIVDFALNDCIMKRAKTTDILALDNFGTEIQDYKRVTSIVNRSIRAFRDTDMLFLATALADYNKEDMNVPNTFGKLSTLLPALFDIVIYLSATQKGERVGFTQPTNKFVAKDRTQGGKLGKSTTNPTIPELFKKARNKEQQDA